MSGQSLKQPPALDELEVTVYGPGKGECILVHIGDGQWLCVDSAHDRGECWAISYLLQLGINPTNALRLIICTHWHSDHVQGLADVVKMCPYARFVCSMALRGEEFQNIVARFRAAEEEFGKIPVPLREIRSVFQTLSERRGDKFPQPTLAQGNLLLDRFDVAGAPVKVHALSPSNRDVMKALESFAGYFVPLDKAATGLSPIEQNHASVVVHIETANDSILLGADLEATKSSHTGWNAVIASALRPPRAEIFKIPHHGSENAYSEKVWQDMLIPQSLAIVTPYVNSGLPKDADIQRLKAQNATIFATSMLRAVRVNRRAEVDKTAREAAPTLTAYRLPGSPGVVRLRKPFSGGQWRYELFGSAQKVS